MKSGSMATNSVNRLVADGKLEEALELAEKQLKERPEDKSLLGDLQQVRLSIVEKGLRAGMSELASLTKKNELDLFVARYEKWVQWFPRNGKLHFVLAMGLRRIGNHTSSLGHMNKALLLHSSIKTDKGVHSYLLHYLTAKTQWMRQRVWSIIKESYSKERGNKAFAFVLPVLSDGRAPLEERWMMAEFLTQRAVTDVQKQDNLFLDLLMQGENCKMRKAAAEWYLKNGINKDVKVLQQQLRKRTFVGARKRRIRTKCYLPTLRKAIKLSRKRKTRPY